MFFVQKWDEFSHRRPQQRFRITFGLRTIAARRLGFSSVLATLLRALDTFRSIFWQSTVAGFVVVLPSCIVGVTHKWLADTIA